MNVSLHGAGYLTRLLFSSLINLTNMQLESAKKTAQAESILFNKPVYVVTDKKRGFISLTQLIEGDEIVCKFVDGNEVKEDAPETIAYIVYSQKAGTYIMEVQLPGTLDAAMHTIHNLCECLLDTNKGITVIPRPKSFKVLINEKTVLHFVKK